MNTNDDILDAYMMETFRALRVAPPRNLHTAAIRRAAFLVEAEQYARGRSLLKVNHLPTWMIAFTSPWAKQRRENGVIWKFAMALAIMVAMFLGTGGAAVFAAQASLPDDALYPVKIWTEETRLQWADGDQDRLHLALEFTVRRVQEIRTMLQAGRIPPESIMTRTQNQLEYTMRIAMGLPEDETVPALVMIQHRLQFQLHQMDQMHLAGETDPAMLQIQNQIRAMLREQIRNLEKNQNCQTPDCLQNQHQNQSNPWITGTTTPGPGYGPDESQNSWVDLTPAPGTNTGPGHNATTTSQPTGVGTGTKPANTPQSNGSGSGSNSVSTPQPHNGDTGTQSTPGSGRGGGGGNP